MAPAYEAICEELGWDVDTAKLEALQKANQQRLEQLDATIKDAEANLGDVEVREARAAKADYLCKIGGSSYMVLPQERCIRVYAAAQMRKTTAQPCRGQKGCVSVPVCAQNVTCNAPVCVADTCCMQGGMSCEHVSRVRSAAMVPSGDRAAAIEAYKKVEETAAGSGLKMDNVFTMLRCPVRELCCGHR